jgi:hypothetical protein
MATAVDKRRETIQGNMRADRLDARRLADALRRDSVVTVFTQSSIGPSVFAERRATFDDLAMTLCSHG